MEQTDYNLSFRNKQPPENTVFRNLQDPLGSIDNYGNNEKGNPILVDYTGIPMVNAQYVFGDKTCTGTCSLGCFPLPSKTTRWKNEHKHGLQHYI